MSYQQELQAIMAKYPEIQDIKVIKEESIKRTGGTSGGIVSTMEPLSPEAQAIASVMKARPPILDTFEVTETRYPVEVKKAAKKVQSDATAAAMKATMAALKPPVL